MLTLTIPRIILFSLLLVISVLSYHHWFAAPPATAPKQLRSAYKVAVPASQPIKKAQQSKRVISTNYDQYDDPAMKSAYFCELALSLRNRCEQIPRDPDSLEFFLKATGYYSNSRHCGYWP